MDSEEEEEDDDPTSATFDNGSKSLNQNDLKMDIDTTDNTDTNDNGIVCISDDILFLCFLWLFSSSLSRCMLVNKHWNETAKDNHLWKIHCSHCFSNKISINNLKNKYNNSYYEYYIKHKKIRFDGIYIIKVLYYIESEKQIPNFNPNQSNYNQPYTIIKYFRYLRFFNNQIKNGINDKSFNCIYSLSKRKASDFKLFNCFNSVHLSHNNINKSNSNIIAEYSTRINGISLNDKVYRGKYNINHKKIINIQIKTDYQLKLILDLMYGDETIRGSSNRLIMKSFKGICMDLNGNDIPNTVDNYEVRHEPFIFIPDIHFNCIDQYLDD